MSVDLPVKPGVSDFFMSSELVDELDVIHDRLLRNFVIALDEAIQDAPDPIEVKAGKTGEHQARDRGR